MKPIQLIQAHFRVKKLRETALNCLETELGLEGTELKFAQFILKHGAPPRSPRNGREAVLEGYMAAATLFCGKTTEEELRSVLNSSLHQWPEIYERLSELLTPETLMLDLPTILQRASDLLTRREDWVTHKWGGVLLCETFEEFKQNQKSQIVSN